MNTNIEVENLEKVVARLKELQDLWDNGDVTLEEYLDEMAAEKNSLGDIAAELPG